MDIIAKYKAACVDDGIMVFTPAGALIKLSPGAINPMWDADKGFVLDGLKKGFELATPAAIEKFKANQALAKAAKAKPAKAPEARQKLKR